MVIEVDLRSVLSYNLNLIGISEVKLGSDRVCAVYDLRTVPTDSILISESCGVTYYIRCVLIEYREKQKKERKITSPSQLVGLKIRLFFKGRNYFYQIQNELSQIFQINAFFTSRVEALTSHKNNS